MGALGKLNSEGLEPPNIRKDWSLQFGEMGVPPSIPISFPPVSELIRSANEICGVLVRTTTHVPVSYTHLPSPRD